MKIDKVAVVGSGLIGAGWAACFLAKGLEVTCADPGEGAEARLFGQVAENFTQIGLKDRDFRDALGRLEFTPNVSMAVRDAGWIQENGPEAIDAKRAIIGQIEAGARADAIIATSTSSLKVSDLQVGMVYPDRLLAGHPFLPVPLVRLVEVSGSGQTSASALETAMDFYRSIEKTPVLLRKEMTGHIANRLQAALMREAFFLLSQGVASASDIDLALTEGPGPRWSVTGPFVSQHLAGGAGGARAAFKALGPAMTAMWNDLGTASLTEELQDQVVQGLAESLALRSGDEWRAERERILRLLITEKPLNLTL
jgi:carnitine 3-dehydrogenase